MELRGSITETIDAPAAKVFAFASDIDRLPEWNALITRVVERPTEMARDAEWVVEMRAMGNTWPTCCSRPCATVSSAKRCASPCEPWSGR
jgi:hypothetical protein